MQFPTLELIEAGLLLALHIPIHHPGSWVQTDDAPLPRLITTVSLDERRKSDRKRGPRDNNLKEKQFAPTQHYYNHLIFPQNSVPFYHRYTTTLTKLHFVLLSQQRPFLEQNSGQRVRQGSFEFFLKVRIYGLFYPLLQKSKLTQIKLLQFPQLISG